MGGFLLIGGAGGLPGFGFGLGLGVGVGHPDVVAEAREDGGVDVESTRLLKQYSRSLGSFARIQDRHSAMRRAAVEEQFPSQTYSSNKETEVLERIV